MQHRFIIGEKRLAGRTVSVRTDNGRSSVNLRLLDHAGQRAVVAQCLLLDQDLVLVVLLEREFKRGVQG